MSKALAVFHGRFGRATVYQLNRPFAVHAHREGHLIFHVGGSPGDIHVDGVHHRLDENAIIAVNPWEPHDFVPADRGDGAIFFVLYINPEWFTPQTADGKALRFGSTCVPRTPPLDAMVRRAAAMVCGAPALPALDHELRELVVACHDASWSGAHSVGAADRTVSVNDFRVRKSINLITENVGSEMRLDSIARGAGLSRPHFYRLFRSMTGVTPNLFHNTLVMERALDAIVASDAPVAEIGYDLGFSSQSAFTRFFASNVGTAPTEYRRAAKVFRP